MTKKKAVCRTCGDTRIKVVAEIGWNVETQEWQIVKVLPSSTCTPCDQATEVELVDLENPRDARYFQLFSDMDGVEAYAARLSDQVDRAIGIALEAESKSRFRQIEALIRAFTSFKEILDEGARYGARDSEPEWAVVRAVLDGANRGGVNPWDLIDGEWECRHWLSRTFEEATA